MPETKGGKEIAISEYRHSKESEPQLFSKEG